MKKFLLIITILFVTINTYSQVKITVDSIYITQIIDTLPIYNGKVMNDIDENWGMGPWVRVYATFENSTNDSIPLEIFGYVLQSSENTSLDSLLFIRNPNGGIFLTFSYKKNKYEVTPDPFSFIPKSGKKDYLMPTTKQSISFGAHILYGTDFYEKYWQPNGHIYFKEMIEILPTLRVTYIAPDGSIYESSGIENVIYRE